MHPSPMAPSTSRPGGLLSEPRRQAAPNATSTSSTGWIDAIDHAWARWHGDWVPWNLARCSRGLVAWDWEYSEPAAPVGLDDVHGRYQQHRVVQRRSVADALSQAAAPSRWLADAHVAMLVARDAELGTLAGVEPDHRAELLDAADGALR